MKDSLQKAQERGLLFLAHSQKPNGGWYGQSYQQYGDCLDIETVFDTVLIMTALSPLRKNKICIDMGGKTLSFLSKEQYPDGSYNYWQKQSPHNTTLAYPNDLDDTALSFACYALYQQESLRGAQLAQLIHLLTSSEVQEGGPYNTWICDFATCTAWKDIDIGVNANIAYVLSILDIKLPRLTQFFDEIISLRNFTSPYYTSPIVLMYLIARAYNGTQKQKLLELIKQEGCTSPGTALLWALETSSRLRLGESVEHVDHLVQRILIAQHPDGSWEREAFYVDPSNSTTVWCHGSSALSTAHCLEALELYQQRQTREYKIVPSYDTEKRLIAEQFIQHARNSSDSFAMLAEESTEHILSEAISAESTVLPYYFYEALSAPNSLLPPSFLATCGLANMFGWAGYTILDEIIDNQQHASRLPFATWCIRHVSQLYSEILPTKQCLFADKILSGIETALYREHQSLLPTHNGLVDIRTLPAHNSILPHQKSLGHALPTLAILSFLGYEESDPIWQSTVSFFTHLLAARQINDDAHDIIEDLKRGLASGVGHDVLLAYKLHFPDHDMLHVEKSKYEVMTIFWKEIYTSTEARIKHHLNQARSSLCSLSLQNPVYFEALVVQLEESQEKSRSDREKMLAFIEAY